MIVRCISNRGADLPDTCLDARAGISRDTVFPISAEREYLVFAVTVYLCHTWYYIINDDNLEYPVWAPGPLFDVSDPTIPPNWKFAYYRYSRGEYPIISFPEWALDETFYERLVDGDVSVRQVFQDRRREMEEVP